MEAQCFLLCSGCARDAIIAAIGHDKKMLLMHGSLEGGGSNSKYTNSDTSSHGTCNRPLLEPLHLSIPADDWWDARTDHAFKSSPAADMYLACSPRISWSSLVGSARLCRIRRYSTLQLQEIWIRCFLKQAYPLLTFGAASTA